jgi:PKD repeat protein
MVSDTDGALAVTFHYSAEAAPGQRITRWELSFGDDSDPEGATVSLAEIHRTESVHSYGVRLDEAGSAYTATFKVWDEESGASPAATDSVVITVQSPPPVVTAFTATPQTGSAPLLDFEFTAQAGAGKSLVKYTLEYGDGSFYGEEGFSEPWTSTLQRSGFTRTYEEAGAYTARVTVWDDAGRKATKELEITVTG